jgi:predicted  nucleic acid-binding Zn-ribbon protein
MSATAEQLVTLHQLHQRARALRERMASGPKTLAARTAAAATRQAELEQARKALQDTKVQLKKHEHAIQGIDTKIDDLKIKLNLVKKNEEYKALQNQIAHDQASKAKIEEEMLVELEAIDSQSADLGKLEADVKRYASEVAALQREIEEQALSHNTQLRELEAAIVAAETTIPETYRDQYRRIVARYGADALAACEDGACHGCFTSLTPQMINDLINGEGLSFCLSCGRLLYLSNPAVVATRRVSST